MEKTFLGNLDWRFATKQFDTSKIVAESDLATIRHAVRFAPASLGLQAYQWIEVTNPEVRAKLRTASYGQPQVTDSASFFVICGRTDLADRIELLLNTMTGGNVEARASLAGYEQMLKGTTGSLTTPEQVLAWTGRQAYISLGFGLAACAELGIDSCPMEGFDPAAVAEILALPSHLKPLAYLAVGYRATGPEHPKFRLPESDLFTTV